MAGIKLENFQGLIPRVSSRLLPPMAATVARNTKLLSGEIRGFRALTEEADLSDCTDVLRRAYRVPGKGYTETVRQQTQQTVPDTDLIFLANFNGANNARTSRDLAKNRTIRISSMGRLDTTVKKFGSASLRLDGITPSLAGGAYADYGSFPSPYIMPTSNGTVEGFMYLRSLPNVGQEISLIEISDGGGNFEMLYVWLQNVGGVYKLGGRFGYGNIRPIATITPALNTWYHFAAQRRYSPTATVIDLFFNGTRVGSVTGRSTPDESLDMAIIRIGYRRGNNPLDDSGGAWHKFHGNLDSLRVVARAEYGDVDTYTVPTVEFAASTTRTVTTVTTRTVKARQWLCFNSRNVDVVRSPLVNDSFDRYYWVGDGRPKMNTKKRINEKKPPYFLGVPAPAAAPTITPPGGSQETRAYVYTFKSAYGEEGQPSPPATQTGASGTWVVSGLPSAPPDAASRNIAKIAIYRTVPGNVSTSFFYVGEVPIGVSTFLDTVTNEKAAANNLLESQTWAPPPDNLEGVIAMPNGYLVGWVGRRLLFTPPYRPHAWPAEYELSTEFGIVGLGVVGATLVICTESQPYFGQGVNPASFTMQKVDAVEPCLSRRGIVTTTAGVLYPSTTGLVLANSSGVRVVTKDLFTKKEWVALSPDTIFAANLGLQYIAFSRSNFGFIIDPENPAHRHVELDNFSDVEGIETDRYSGNVLVLSRNRVWNWDPETVNRLNWRWKSKAYHFPKPLNFGAARLKFDIGESSQALPVTIVYKPYNEELFADLKSEPGIRNRLNTVGGQVLGGRPAKPVLGLVPSQPTIIENRQPLGGSLLHDLGFLQLTTKSVRVRMIVYPDSKKEKVVYDRQIVDESIFRLPTGFKADLWQFELIGNTAVYSLQVAETPNGLASV